MIDLIIAMSCSASIALLFKFSEGRNYPRLAVTVFNYLIGVIISLLMLLTKPIELYAIDISQLTTELSSVISGELSRLSPASSMLWSVAIGSLTGALFLSNFIYYQKSVKYNGAGLSGTFQKMGVVIPVIIAIFIFREYPSPLQWLGIALAVVMIVYLNSGSQQQARHVYLLLILFFMGGFSEFSNKLFQQYALDDYRSLFLFVVFASALTLSSVMMLRDRAKLSMGPCMMGALVGVANYGSSYFLIQSLSSLSASLAFPTFSIGSLTIIIVFSHFIYREVLSRRERLALAIATVALFLMNV